MASSPFVPLIEVVRGEVLECIHHGAVAVVDAAGRLHASLGDPSFVTYLRSVAKPFQLLPLVEQGLAERYGFGPRELAIMAASLQALARAFARLAEPPAALGPSAAAARRVRDAMRQNPELIGGTAGRVDTELMRLGHGLVAKGGAEGVLCVGLPPHNGRPALGLAVKIADGDAARRARGPATIAALRQLGALAEPDLATLGEQARPVIRNVAGRLVGQVRAVFNLTGQGSSSLDG